MLQIFLSKHLKSHVLSQIARYTVSKGYAGTLPKSYDGANFTENAARICVFTTEVNGDFLGFW